mgnify:FL=1
MRSWVAKTEEIDDLEVAVEELKNGIPTEELLTNTVGIAYVYYDADFEELSKMLSETFQFPIIGVSAMALLDHEGYLAYGMELLVMSADDVRFSVGMTDRLDKDNYEEKLEKLYDAMKGDIQEQEKLILAYTGKVVDADGDIYVKTFDKISGGVPVYGGMPSDMYTYKDFKVFYDGKVVNYAAVVILVYGNVSPITLVEFSISNETSLESQVTKALGNIVFSLGDKTFIQTLEEAGLSSDNENVIKEYIQTPFVVKKEVENGETIEFLRNLAYLKHDTGIGVFLGQVPEGAELKVATVSVDDIGKSVTQVFTDLIHEMEKRSDYQYSTIICTSCTARYMNIIGDKNIEGNAYKDIIPDDINLVGMYSYGELCPTKSSDSDKLYNMFHNETFTILAL